MIQWLRTAIAAFLLVVFTFVLLPVQLVCLWLDLRPRRVLPRLWHRAACHALGIRVRVHGDLNPHRP